MGSFPTTSSSARASLTAEHSCSSYRAAVSFSRTVKMADLGELIFSESEELSSEENAEEVTRGDKFVSVANATEDDIEVVIDETTLVRKDHKTGKKFGIGAAPLAGAAKLEVDLGDTSYATLTAKAQPHDVGPHSQWRVLVPPSAMQLRGLSMNVTNSVQVVVFRKSGEENIQKLGRFILGPGHGIIIFKFNNKYQTEQAKGRSWLRRFDPWKNTLGHSRDPHARLEKGEECDACGYFKSK